MAGRRACVGLLLAALCGCSDVGPSIAMATPGGGAGAFNTSGGATGGTAGTATAMGGASAGGVSGAEQGGRLDVAGMAGAPGGVTSGGVAGAGGNGGVSGLAGGGSGGASDPAERPGWTLVWRDEFDGPAGSSPDATKWTPRVERATANQELEFYNARPENLSLDGQGFLRITARKEQYMGASYTSARIETGGKFEQAYGRFEARLKIPHGQGIWPAFWIMGNNADAGWPGRGELDIMENRGKEPTITLGAMHGPGYSGSKDFRAEHVISEGVWQNFHVFAIEWEPNVARWYVDDELFETRTPQDLIDRGGNLKWVYDHPFFILMNVAVGGLFPGNPDATTPFPQTLEADYVRVYER